MIQYNKIGKFMETYTTGEKERTVGGLWEFAYPRVMDRN